SQVDGVSEIAINIRKDETALSEALKYMLYRRCDILSCVLEEEKLEEVFTNLLQEVATPALRGGSPGT
ncbi:MAG TPA: hypothetical protein VN203_06140, partial [Candidatus Acidoferrum sp.]|nr:hypothetical protein [Candidatus Acidoferrum sp.]